MAYNYATQSMFMVADVTNYSAGSTFLKNIFTYEPATNTWVQIVYRLREGDVQGMEQPCIKSVLTMIDSDNYNFIAHKEYMLDIIISMGKLV